MITGCAAGHEVGGGARPEAGRGGISREQRK